MATAPTDLSVRTLDRSVQDSEPGHYAQGLRSSPSPVHGGLLLLSRESVGSGNLVVQSYHPKLRYRLTGTTGIEPDKLQLDPHCAGSRESPFALCHQELAALDLLEDDWDSYGAERPRPHAIRNADLALEVLFDSNIVPQKVLPCADGGVTINIARRGDTVLIECFNDGDVVLGVQSASGDTRTRVLSAPGTFEFEREIREISELA